MREFFYNLSVEIFHNWHKIDAMEEKIDNENQNSFWGGFGRGGQWGGVHGEEGDIKQVKTKQPLGKNIRNLKPK